ncbi:unnamed protein product [Sphagnum jensenii]
MSAGAIRIYEDARATACSLSSLQMHQQQCGPAAAAAARDAVIEYDDIAATSSSFPATTTKSITSSAVVLVGVGIRVGYPRQVASCFQV